ncbi:hypothetical protein G9A89_007703 [Geosiphon pyriformis]|nr:hypothetical protein G9A89_007703 [Geosiphon pyriformis]
MYKILNTTNVLLILLIFSISGKSQRLIDLTRDIDFFRTLSKWISIQSIDFGRERLALLRGLSNKSPIENILFVGHSIGGAYATIAGLTWTLETSLIDRRNEFPLIKFSTVKISAITFGAPRVGNRIFARVVNQLLKVKRITYFNDHVPHFPPREVGNNLLEHFETEYWILPCECSPGKNDENYLFYECKGFEYPKKSQKYDDQLTFKLLFPYGDSVTSGENENCNAGQSINDVTGNFIHKGPYFGIKMNDCSLNNIQINL